MNYVSIFLRYFLCYNKSGDYMNSLSTKKLLLINVILVILIVITIGGTILFNNYLYVPYDPFDDPSEYERLKGTRLSDDEIPSVILDKADDVMSEYSQVLENKKVGNIEIGKIVALLYNDGKYHLKYVVVDENANKIIATIYFRFIKDGTIVSITADYRYFTESDFLTYNNALIELESLNISNEDIFKIKNKFRSSVDSSWYIGNNYRYDYYNKEQVEGVYGGINDLRTFTIIF